MKKDFLKLSDLNKDEVLCLLKEAEELKQLKASGVAHRPLEGKTLGMIFNKNSTRTRISFEVGMFELGGHSLFLTPDQMQLGRGETIADSARVLSRYLDGILIRTFNFKEIEELAKHASIPVINGLTDLNHPIQILSDLFTIHEKLGHLDGIKIAYVGDGNNVAYSWINAAVMFDLRLSVGCPASCRPELPKEISIPDCIEITEDPIAAVKDADVIYTDVWISMGQEEVDEKVTLLKPYQINQSLVNAAKKDTLVMHCLPAHREMEITTEVLEGKNSIVFDQAENRLHLQKALLKTLLS